LKKGYIYLITILLTIFTGVVDILTSHQFRLSAIYIISIFSAAYYLNRYYSILLALLSIFFSLFTALMHFKTLELFMIWNNIMTLGIYFLIIFFAVVFKNKIEFEKINYSLQENNQLLEKNIREKNILIMEIHHRVKNNFLAIESLIDMTIKDQSPDQLKAIHSRLNTYKLLYNKLCYSSEIISVVLLADYLHDLIKLIIINCNTNNYPVAFQIHGGDFNVDSKIAHSMGLIINELATNSLKYAFTGIAQGQINLSIKKTENRITLIYSDNGPGFNPGTIAPENKHLGLLLIENLTQQLNGNFHYAYRNGSEYTFDFQYT